MSYQSSYKDNTFLLDYKTRIGDKYLPPLDFPPIILENNSNIFNSGSYDNFRSDLCEKSTQKVTTENSSMTFRRTSVCKQFDPLYDMAIKIGSETYGCELNKTVTLPEYLRLNYASDKPIVLYKTRASLTSEEALISFASPKKTNKPLILPRCLQFEKKLPRKTYSKNEFSEILKEEGSKLTDELLRKYKTLEIDFDEKDLSLLKEGSQLICQCETLTILLSEMHGILRNMSSNNDELQSKLDLLECNNAFLKEQIITVSKESKAVENVLSELVGRYDQCKRMIDCYEENEKQLKNSMDDLEDALSKQININYIQNEKHLGMYEGRKEVKSVKLVETEAQALEAALRKAETKIVELENDFIQSKKINFEIRNRYESLVGKVNE